MSPTVVTFNREIASLTFRLLKTFRFHTGLNIPSVHLMVSEEPAIRDSVPTDVKITKSPTGWVLRVTGESPFGNVRTSAWYAERLFFTVIRAMVPHLIPGLREDVSEWVDRRESSHERPVLTARQHAQILDQIIALSSELGDLVAQRLNSPKV